MCIRDSPAALRRQAILDGMGEAHRRVPVSYTHLVGIILAFVAIVGGNFLEGGHAGALLNGPAALIVIGGTLAAALLQTPVNVLKRGLGMLGWVFFPPREDLSGGIDRIVSWSMTARKEGLLGLESIACLLYTSMPPIVFPTWWK